MTIRLGRECWKICMVCTSQCRVINALSTKDWFRTILPKIVQSCSSLAYYQSNYPVQSNSYCT